MEPIFWYQMAIAVSAPMAILLGGMLYESHRRERLLIATGKALTHTIDERLQQKDLYSMAPAPFINLIKASGNLEIHSYTDNGKEYLIVGLAGWTKEQAMTYGHITNDLTGSPDILDEMASYILLSALENPLMGMVIDDPDERVQGWEENQNPVE